MRVGDEEDPLKEGAFKSGWLGVHRIFMGYPQPKLDFMPEKSWVYDHPQVLFHKETNSMICFLPQT